MCSGQVCLPGLVWRDIKHSFCIVFVRRPKPNNNDVAPVSADATDIISPSLDRKALLLQQKNKKSSAAMDSTDGRETLVQREVVFLCAFCVDFGAGDIVVSSSSTNADSVHLHLHLH